VNSGMIRIDWHPTIRASARRRGTGFVVSIEANHNGSWQEAIKIDAFGRAHWHIYGQSSGESVRPLTGAGKLHGGDLILRAMAEHLTCGGFAAAASQLSEDDVTELINNIGNAIDALAS
jgi:hypothetical protein